MAHLPVHGAIARKAVEELDINLFCAMQRWLQKHGKVRHGCGSHASLRAIARKLAGLRVWFENQTR